MKHNCLEHPRYRGKREPKQQCTKCLALYIFLRLKPRLPIPPPSHPMKDSTTYTRKKKHKKKATDG